MSRKVTVMIFLMVSLAIISWSTNVMAEEKAQKSREARIRQVEEQIKEIEYALERERNDDKAANLKETLQKRRRELGSARGKSEKTRGELSTVQIGIQRAKGNIAELKQAVKAMKEKGDAPDRLEELQKEIGQEAERLAKLNQLLEKQKAGTKRKKERPRTKLMFFPLEHANAQNLSKIIQEFLTPSGTVLGDPDSNILVIKATPNDLEIAMVIIKNLDVPKRRAGREQPRRRREPRERTERRERENFFLGKVLKAGKKSLTIKTRDSGEEVTLYVPLRKKEDGTSVPNKELANYVASFDVGTDVRVQWRQDGRKRFIQRVTDIKKEVARRKREEQWEVFFGTVLKSSKKSITIKTRDSGEEVTIYVPLRKKEDGTMVLYEELSAHVASFDVGANVKIQWQQDGERRLMKRVTRIEE